MKRFLVLLVLLCAACGGGGGSDGQTPTGLLEEEPQVVSTDRYEGFWPAANMPKAVVVVLSGHGKFNEPCCSMIPVVEYLQDADFDVYGFSMIQGVHGPPISEFYEPIVQFIESLNTNLPIFVVGLSGGGWTTTVVTAYCKRVTKGYSVAGDLPLDLRTWVSDVGDWEQQHPPAPYRDMYAMAAGRLLHIYHYSDSCCFGYLDQYGLPRWDEKTLGTPFFASNTNGGLHIISLQELKFIIMDMEGLI